MLAPRDAGQSDSEKDVRSVAPSSTIEELSGQKRNEHVFAKGKAKNRFERKKEKRFQSAEKLVTC